MSDARRSAQLTTHLAALKACRACPRMQSVPVTGRAVLSRVLLVGQAPGDREPVAQQPFAWTAGRTLFRWFAEACGLDEPAFRAAVYMTAVCRCFPGKKASGGDRVPAAGEIDNCATWLRAEFALLRPALVIPVGRLAIARFGVYRGLEYHIGRQFRGAVGTAQFDLIALPHPSGASPWPRVEPGKSLLLRALQLIAAHPAIRGIRDREAQAGTTSRSG